jgi:hypothetical protein
VRAGQLLGLRADRGGERGRIRVHLPHDLGHDPVALFEESQQQVLRSDFRMTLPVGELLCAEDRLLRLLGVLVHVHRAFSDFLRAS